MKKVLSIISIVFILAATAGVMMTSAASGPNTGGMNEDDWIDRYAYVHIRPSYLDAGRHAVQGRVRAIVIDRDGNVTYTGYSCTTYATNIYDQTLYTAESHPFTLIQNDVYAQYAFKWNTSSTWEPNGYQVTE